MPVLKVEMLVGRSREQKREMAEVFTREMARIARCKPDAVQVVFSEVDRESWAVGGRLESDKSPTVEA